MAPTLGELAAIAPVPPGTDRRGSGGRIVAGSASAGEVQIAEVAHDSRTVGPQALFACLRGATFDGHHFVPEAAAAGAVALLVDHELSVDEARGLPQLVVADTRFALGPIAADVAGNPTDTLTTVGITGTNGKTSTAAMTAAIFEANGWRTGVLGTLAGTRTTPEAPELQRRLAGFVADDFDAAVLEVSSHALALHRVDGTRFDVIVFTNLGRDHLDLHGSQAEYFRAKARVFDPAFASVAVINVDDPHGRLLADTVVNSGGGLRVVELTADDLDEIDVSPTGHSYRWRDHVVEVPIGGHFNVANSHAALVVATELGVPAEVAIEGLRAMPQIPGRFEHVVAGDAGFSVVVDYAHTPDGLRELIAAAREAIGPRASVIVVFGCGGERDQEKRPEMGTIAATSADRVIVTSDNPRGEDPQRIVDEILAGVPGEQQGRVTSIVDRGLAIGAAIGAASSGDIVLIAGKGHETYQDLGDRTIDFDDRVVARAILEERP
jgi:UDP-N-acetylmuramoyl-L-alanyl-D-glutamate--2,6-diaminopimelate ligase